MRPSRAVVVLLSTLLFFGALIQNGVVVRAADAPAPMPLISRGAPAFTNDTCGGAYPASLANDASYDTQWRACSTPSAAAPVYLAYDLSAVPFASRGRVLVAWYNDPITSPYEHGYVGQVGYDIPSTYTIESNAAPGGALPGSGWVTLASVSGNAYHSREQLVDLAGASWLRMRVTATDGSSGNTGVYLNLDVHDAAAGAQDSWVFFGDSITQAGLAHNSLGVGTWAQLVNAARASFYPAFEDGGIGGTLSADGVARIAAWLAVFPGRYVALAYGSNDAGYSVSPDTFYSNYTRMVDAVLAAGKVPVVPRIPWGCTGALQANASGLNARIDALYAAYPSVVRGPDLWTYFANNTGLISGDCLHPTNQGYAGMRQQWANAMLANVYAGTPSPTPTVAPTATASPTAAPTTSPTVAPTATPSATPAANRLLNAGFESGAASWSLASTATIDATAANAHSGARSLRLAATGAWQGSWQSVAVTAGQTYSFSAWQRSASSGGFLSVFSFNASNVQIDQGTHLVYSGGGAWTYLAGTYLPPAGTARALIGVQSSGAGTYFFDDLYLGSGAAPTATPSPAPTATPSPAPTATPSPTPTVTPTPTPAPTATPAPPATNRVVNPGFESGAASWTLASTATIDATAANAHSGARSLRLAATSAWQGSWQSVAVTPGQTYSFSVWERSSTSGGFLSVFSFNASNVQIDQGTHLVFSASAGWTQLTGTYVAPAGTAWALIGVQSSGAGTFWFDDVSLAGP